MGNEDYGNGALRIVNKALVLLGQDVTVEEMREDSAQPVARKCAVLYTDARHTVLRDHAWAFARREIPVHSSCKGGHAGLFPYIAPKPVDAFRIVVCYDEHNKPVQHVVQGTQIRSAAPVKSIVYIEDVDDLELWDAGAYQALILRLCADLAKPVTGRINEVQLQEQKYREYIEKAKEQDAANDNMSDVAWGSSSFLRDAMLGKHDVPTVTARNMNEYGVFAR